MITRKVFLRLCFALLLCGLNLQGQAQAAPAAGNRVDLIVSGGTVVTMDGERRVYEDGAVAVNGDRIVAIGSRKDLAGKYRAARNIDAHGKLVMPGLVNGHTHAAMTLLRGVANDLSLQDWLTNYIFPAEARNVTEDFVVWGTRLALLEMLRGGTTTFADMYYYEDLVARETKAANMRAVLGAAVADFPIPGCKNVSEELAYAETFLKRWKGDPLVRAAVAPHSIYTVSGKTLQDSFALARKYGAPVLIHVSETKKETDDSLAKNGSSPVAYLDRLGLLGPDMVAAHCVWVDAADIALLKKRNVGCVHNPSSNMMLASGTAPVVEMRAAGMRLGLGTDGPSSNNDLDLLEEADLAAKLQKVTRMDPRALSAEQALEMATIGGARALHMENEIGSLEAGKKADLIVMDLGAPHAVPLYDLYAQIVYSLKGSDVETVLIAGRPVMENRFMLTLNEPEIIAKARAYGLQVKKSLAASPPRD